MMLETELSDAEKVQIAVNNHMWINAFSCLNPSDEVCIAVGREVISRLNNSEIDGNLLDLKIGKVLYMRFNKS